MATIYIPAIIWIFGAAICYVIAKKRNLKTSAILDIAFCVLAL